MPTTYTETPDNFNEIGTFVEKEINGIKKIFYLAQRVIFYDACSFQKHSERMSYVYSSLNITTLISASAIFFMNAIYSSAKLCLSDASSIKIHFVINTTVPCIL